MTEHFLNERLKHAACETVNRVRSLVKTGNVTRVLVERKGETLLNLPLTVSAVGLVAAPAWAILLATLATFGLDCAVTLVTAEGKKISVV